MGGVIISSEVLNLFMSQHSVASIEQLRDLDVSERTLRRARQHGVLTNVIPGIVRLTGSPETFASRAMALQLHTGGDSFVSGFSAGAIYGLRAMPRTIVEVTVPEIQRRVMPPWGRLHRSSWIDLERDIASRGCLRLASPTRMLFRLAAVFNQHRFQRAAEDCWHLQLVTPDDAVMYLAEIRRQGRTGVKTFEHWLEHTSLRTRPSQSGLELDVLEAVLRAGLPEPERQFPLALRTGEVIHLDLAWPNARLGVEPGTHVVARRRCRHGARRGKEAGVRRGRLAHRPVHGEGPRRPPRVRATGPHHPRRAARLASSEDQRPSVAAEIAREATSRASKKGVGSWSMASA